MREARISVRKLNVKTHGGMRVSFKPRCGSVFMCKDLFSWVLWNQYEKKTHLSVAKIKMSNPLLSKKSDTCEFALWTWWQYKRWWMAGKKRASHNKLSENVSLSWCWEGPFHIYYSRLSMANISDFNAPCTANPLPIFPISISAGSSVMHSSPLYLPLSVFWCVRTNHDLLGLRLWKDLWCRSRFL